jgi:hypothetical protein
MQQSVYVITSLKTSVVNSEIDVYVLNIYLRNIHPLELLINGIAIKKVVGCIILLLPGRLRMFICFSYQL